jgi:GTP-binding protein
MEQRRKLWRERRWVHYPTYEDDNTGRSAFKQAEWDIWRAEREMRRARKRQRNAEPLVLDLDHIPPEATAARAPDAPLGLPRIRQFGTLIASGGVAGYGNPHFYSTTNPSPKFATRGYEGERVTLELELKLLADVGLVGAPNAGKSTLLRALTAGRARSTVAGYAFTTLNPVVGVVRIAEDGSVLGGEDGGGHGETDVVYDETVVEKRRERELMESGAFADLPTRNRAQGDTRAASRGVQIHRRGQSRTHRGRVGQRRARALVSAVDGALARARLRRRSFWPGALGRAPDAPGRAGKVQKWDERAGADGHR